MKTTLPLKWHGGKHYLTPHIIRLTPPHLHYVEVFAGGLRALFARDHQRDWMRTYADQKLPAHLRGCSELVNDLNGELSNFWAVLADETQFAEFQRIVQATPFSQPAFESSLDQPSESESEVQRAVRFFIRYRQSRGGMGKDFATMSRKRTRRKMNEQAASWLSAIDGLADAHDRLKGVVVRNEDGVKLIRQQDGPATFFYADPPYSHETRTATDVYELEMSIEQHVELLETLASIEGKFLLSGYPNQLYGDFARRHGWISDEIEIDNKQSGKSTKDKKIEVLWRNYSING